MASKNELNEIITIYNDPLLKMAPNNNYIENNYIKNIVYINNSILKDDYHRDFDGCRSYYPVKNKPPIDDKPSTKKTNDEPEKIPVQPIIPQADTSAINPPVKKKIPTEPEKSPLPPFVDKPQINDKPKKTIDDEPEKIPVQPIIPQADTSAINPQSIKDKVAQLLKQKKETPPNSEQKTEIEFYDPQKIVSYLDRFVTGQESAKKTIALAFSDYLNTGIVTPSLFVGPSGSGKTYMTDLLCRAAKIPYVKISMANVTS